MRRTGHKTIPKRLFTPCAIPRTNQDLTMLGITREDFTIRAPNFDLTQPWNLLRIAAGAFMFPHVASKFAAGWLSAGVVGFFAKAGFQPPKVWVILAALVESGTGLALVLAICTRFAALGAASALAIAVFALHSIKGFSWLWNMGGYGYPIFRGITCVAVAMNAFIIKRSPS